MPLTLPTFAPGSTIDATAMRGKRTAAGDYLNEGIVAADRASNWCGSTQLRSPDWGLGKATFPSGETYWQHIGDDKSQRSIFSWRAASTPSYQIIPGLCKEIQMPETIRQGASPYYRVYIRAKCYIGEYGGKLSTLDENTNHAASVALFINESHVTSTDREVYTASDDVGTPTSGVMFAWHNHSFMYAENGDWGGFLAPGINTVSVRIQNYVPGNDNWKHIFVGPRTLIVRYFIR